MQQRRIQRLKDERKKLLDGYYAGAIPLEVLKTDPDWQALPPRTPVKIRRLLQDCLQKEFKIRLQDIFGMK